MDLLAESLSTLSELELRVIYSRSAQEADRLREAEPGYSCVWRAMSLAAEQARLSRRSASR